jgi:hypothetical protein
MASAISAEAQADKLWLLGQQQSGGSGAYWRYGLWCQDFQHFSGIHCKPISENRFRRNVREMPDDVVSCFAFCLQRELLGPLGFLSQYIDSVTTHILAFISGDPCFFRRLYAFCAPGIWLGKLEQLGKLTDWAAQHRLPLPVIEGLRSFQEDKGTWREANKVKRGWDILITPPPIFRTLHGPRLWSVVKNHYARQMEALRPHFPPSLKVVIEYPNIATAVVDGLTSECRQLAAYVEKEGLGQMIRRIPVRHPNVP